MRRLNLLLVSGIVALAISGCGGGTASPSAGVSAATGSPVASPSAVVSAAPSASPRPNGVFSSTGSMVAERDQWAMSTLLADGRVLVTGGVDYSVLDSPYLSSAEIYDPATGVWSKTGSMTKGRGGHTATLLKNGKVLIAGSCDNDKTAELFDPGTNKFSSLGKMAVSATCGSTATLLPNGSVLLEGGASTGIVASKLAEIYDPATGRFSRTGSMATARSGAQAVLLGDGRVLVVGGDQESDNEVDLNSAEIYNPATGKFTEAGSMETPRTQFSATLLGNGSVLVAGGSNMGGVP
jgi:N-acetylneuraminic acid mutarotase